jgi:hypothetical protein
LIEEGYGSRQLLRLYFGHHKRLPLRPPYPYHIVHTKQTNTCQYEGKKITEYEMTNHILTIYKLMIFLGFVPEFKFGGLVFLLDIKM